MKTFRLVREYDETGMSGTGDVAEGVQFSNGKCVLAWQTEYQSVAVYDSIEDVETIHGHHGHTRIEWDADLVPLPGGKYAIPKERIEAAIEKMAEMCAADGTAITKRELLRHYRAIYEREVFAVLTAALGGEVYPVEAVGRVTDSGVGDPTCYLSIGNATDGTLRTVDGFDFVGRTVALIADGQEEAT